MINKLSSYRNFLSEQSYCKVYETYHYLTLSCSAKSDQISNTVLAAFNLNQDEIKFVSSLRITLILPDEDISVELALSSSQTNIQKGTVSQTDISAIQSFADIPTVEKIVQICTANTPVNPDNLLAMIKIDSIKLDSIGFIWELSMTLSKEPLLEILKTLNPQLGISQSLCVFISLKSVIGFLEQDQGLTFYEQALSSGGFLVVFVGGINATVSGSHLVFTELWSPRSDLSDTIPRLSSLDKLQIHQDFLKRAASPGVGAAPVVPMFFEIGEIADTNETRTFRDALNLLQAFYSLLNLSTYASESEHDGVWTLKIVGARTVQSEIHISGNTIHIDGKPFSRNLTSFLALAQWIFSDTSTAKLSIAQRTAALHSSNFTELIDGSEFILRSSEAAHELYIHEMVSDVMEVRQRFSEYLLDWSRKDVDSRMKLDDAVNLTTLGGLSTIIASIIALAVQSFDPSIVSTAWAVVPPLLALYIVSMLIRILQTSHMFDTYMDGHVRQVKFYTDVLGKQVVHQIAGSTKKADLEQQFKKKKKDYLTILGFLLFFAVLFWLIKMIPLLVDSLG